MLPTYSDFARMPWRIELADEEIEADAMAADDDEVGGLERLARAAAPATVAAGIEDLGVLVDGDEAVGAAERGHRARALAHRIGGEALRSPAPGRPAGTRCVRARS